MQPVQGILRLSSADRALVSIPEDLKQVLVGILLCPHKVLMVYAHIFFKDLCVNDYANLTEIIELKYIVLYLAQLCNLPGLMHKRFYLMLLAF